MLIIKILISIVFITSFLSQQNDKSEEIEKVLGDTIEVDEKQNELLEFDNVNNFVLEEVVVYRNINKKCLTEKLDNDVVKQLIIDNQTTDYNLVGLAEVESHLNNHAKNRNLIGIFQVNTRFHKMDDYCDPVQQVNWLERKLDEGADPKNLFPTTYGELYK